MFSSDYVKCPRHPVLRHFLSYFHSSPPDFEPGSVCPCTPISARLPPLSRPISIPACPTSLPPLYSTLTYTPSLWQRRAYHESYRSQAKKAMRGRRFRREVGQDDNTTTPADFCFLFLRTSNSELPDSSGSSRVHPGNLLVFQHHWKHTGSSFHLSRSCSISVGQRSRVLNTIV